MNSEIKKIQIAPYPDEITLSGNEIRTDFAGGITYKADGLEKYDQDFLKEAFSTAIAVSGRRWYLEKVLNDYLHLKGTIS